MRALSIVALVFSVLGCFAPLFAGAIISALSGALAIWECKKLRPYAFAPLIINVINLLVFSPQKLSSGANGIVDMEPSLWLFVLCFMLPILLIQVIGAVVYIKNTRKNNQTKT